MQFSPFLLDFDIIKVMGQLVKKNQILPYRKNTNDSISSKNLETSKIAKEIVLRYVSRVFSEILSKIGWWEPGKRHESGKSHREDSESSILDCRFNIAA